MPDSKDMNRKHTDTKMNFHARGMKWRNEKIVDLLGVKDVVL